MDTKHLIEKISLKSGPKGSSQPLEFVPASVNVFVGPNHSGKSLLLRELQAAIQHPQQAPLRKVLKDLSFTPWTDEEKKIIADELKASAKPAPEDATNMVRLENKHYFRNVNKVWFETFLEQLPHIRDLSTNEAMREYFLHRIFLMLGGGERLSLLQPTERESPLGKYGLILSRLVFSDDKRKKAQSIIYDAFKCHFVISTVGKNFEPMISIQEPPAGVERSLEDKAVEFFRQCRPLQEMSDGVKAFCGMVASVVANDARVIFIDEPEAFLHPALSTKLAIELCRLAQANGQQLFIATHSASFLKGCVQAGVYVNIIRLTYRENSATSRLLPQQELVPLMRQPLLRSIGALTGIFYESVVVTEADADRAFYDEVNHRCLGNHHAGGIADCLFLNAQNWQTTSRIIAPLRRLGIAAAAIVDIDLLLESKSDAFQTLVESAGMPTATRQSLGQLRGNLHAILKPLEKDVKKRGIACVTGNNQRDLLNFIDQLANYGVFVVPTGELECWLPNLTRGQWAGKAEWLLRTFEGMGEDVTNANYLKPSGGDVWDFMIRIGSWLHNPRRLGMTED